jgi:hypothetical protein
LTVRMRAGGDTHSAQFPSDLPIAVPLLIRLAFHVCLRSSELLARRRADQPKGASSEDPLRTDAFPSQVRTDAFPSQGERTLPTPGPDDDSTAHSSTMDEKCDMRHHLTNEHRGCMLGACVDTP